MKNIIVSGSTAFDNIMKNNSNIKEHLSEKEMGHINISYIVSDLKKEIGGTGLNIAYNLAILGTKSILLTSIGRDFSFSDFIKEKVELKYVNISEKYLTARSYITTDLNKNQITAFHPGAMKDSINIKEIEDENAEYTIVSANNIEIMKKHIKSFKDKGFKTFFDPGQQITQMTKEDLNYCFNYSNYIILNKYEYEIIKKFSEKSDGEMIELFEKIIITDGINGSKILDHNYNFVEIEGINNPKYIDATGVGEAYRAGLLKGLNEGYNWKQSAQIGTLLSSISTSYNGAQNHFINWYDLKTEYAKFFGEELKK